MCVDMHGYVCIECVPVCVKVHGWDVCVSMCVQICMSMCIKCVHVYVNVYSCVCIQVCSCVNMCVWMCMDMCVLSVCTCVKALCVYPSVCVHKYA